MKKKHEEKTQIPITELTSLEERLRAIMQIYKEDIVATVFIKSNGDIILGRAIGKSAVSFEPDFAGEDEEDEPVDVAGKINPLSMELRPDYFG